MAVTWPSKNRASPRFSGTGSAAGPRPGPRRPLAQPVMIPATRPLATSAAARPNRIEFIAHP